MTMMTYPDSDGDDDGDDGGDDDDGDGDDDRGVLCRSVLSLASLTDHH